MTCFMSLHQYTREFFVPVRDDEGKVIGYYERHEVLWNEDNPQEPVGEYWKRGK